MYRVLIVEDDCDLAEITRINLEFAGYETEVAYTSAEAEGMLGEGPFDVILLDVQLPDGTGDGLCRTIREHYRTPVIFVSCLDDSGTIVRSLSSGGDDYVVKPVQYDQLIARIEANIRREREYVGQRVIPPMTDGPQKRLRSFTLDTDHRRVILDSGTVDLSAIECAILLYFIEKQDTLVVYEDLYESVWKNDCLGDVRTVMVHISNLRKKIDPLHRGIIETVRGAGYIFTDI